MRALLWKIYAPLSGVVAWFVKLGWRLGGRPWSAYEKQGIVPIPLHFYHPYPKPSDPSLIRYYEQESNLAGIEIGLASSLSFLDRLGHAFGAECTWPERSDDPHVYHCANGTFGYASAAATHAMIRHFKPRRVIEIGSGYSTHILGGALARNALDGPTAELISVEPYPAEILNAEIPCLAQRIERPVEEVDRSLFDSLGADDVLFIDSSHVIRYGGDVLFLYLNVLPSLAPGVVVHIHDIHLPDPYPRAYFDENRYVWNEQYLLQAFLCGNARFRVLLPCWLIHRKHDDRFRRAFPRYDPALHRPGSSMWIQRTLD